MARLAKSLQIIKIPKQLPITFMLFDMVTIQIRWISFHNAAVSARVSVTLEDIKPQLFPPL
jgi:hypothetical protein